MSSLAYKLFETPIGTCAIVWGERGIVSTFLPEGGSEAMRDRVLRRFRDANEAEPPVDVHEAVTAIGELLAGAHDDLREIALDMRAIPEFNQRVYAIARAIPPGHTRTYGEIATELGDLSLARSVGQALGSNPFPIVVPCHRVMGAGGRSGGFSAPGGVATKLKLLQIEGAPLGGTPGLFD
jgi:methylated-DNA-[protein]-cysteine S-methyltransferase